MKRLKSVGLTTLVVLVASVVTATTATTATAIEGPFYRSCKNVGAKLGKYKDGTCTAEGGEKEWEKVRLKEKEIKFISGKANKNFVISSLALTITCTSLKLNGNSAINGSNGDNPGFGETVIEFGGCTVAGNGAPCAVVNGEITTKILKFTLGYAEKKPKKGTALLALFAPTEGAVIFTANFAGEGCKIPVVNLEGTVAAEDQNGKGVTIKAEEEPALETVEEFSFPAAKIAAAFIGPLVGGEATEKKTKLTTAGLAAKLEGRMEVELASKEAWGMVVR